MKKKYYVLVGSVSRRIVLVTIVGKRANERYIETITRVVGDNWEMLPEKLETLTIDGKHITQS